VTYVQDVGDMDIDGELFLVARVYKIGKIYFEIVVPSCATMSVFEMESYSKLCGGSLCGRALNHADTALVKGMK